MRRLLSSSPWICQWLPVIADMRHNLPLSYHWRLRKMDREIARLSPIPNTTLYSWRNPELLIVSQFSPLWSNLLVTTNIGAAHIQSNPKPTTMYATCILSFPGFETLVNFAFSFVNITCTIIDMHYATIESWSLSSVCSIKQNVQYVNVNMMTALTLSQW